MLRQTCLALVVLSALAGAQTTWYVDVNAVPPGSGTQASPFTSIQQAVSSPAVASGHTILVAPGVYEETVAVHKAVSVRSRAGPLVTWIEPNAPASDVGAVVRLHSFNAEIRGFTISGARAGSSSGVYGVIATARDCVLTGHRQDASQSLFSGCGVVSDYDFFIEGCTITRNAKGFEIEHVAAVYARNSILQGNTVHDLDPLTPSSVSTIDYTLFGTGAASGTGNLSGDPRFWNPAESDFRLAPPSPCIDAGDPAAPLDPDGSRRDMGAIAYDSTYAPGPSVFCTGKLNSDGCVPQIGSNGHATAGGAEPFVVTAANQVPGKSGLLFYGPGKRSQPFQGGLHCVQLPTKRVGVQAAVGSGPCGGASSFDFATYLASGANPALQPGSLVACQWWSRDPLDPAGFGTALSDALFFGIAP